MNGTRTDRAHDDRDSHFTALTHNGTKTNRSKTDGTNINSTKTNGIDELKKTAAGQHMASSTWIIK